MAVRRSARLRSRQASEESQPPSDPVPNNHDTNDNNNHNNNNHHSHEHKNHSNNLPTVMERDENPIVHAPPAPTHSPSSKKPAVQTPVKSTPVKSTPAHKKKTPAAKTPTRTPTSVVTRPPHQEMHPSKVHQSTTKQADSGLILGFNPIPKDSEGNVVKDSLVQNTPTKMKPSPAPTNYGTPGFEFKFACQESQLSDEAKKLMESVREDVAKIKAQMIQQQGDLSPQKQNELQQAVERRIAQPKGKASRFSDVHMAEFKKMDSIAGHASAFRATPGRFQPVEKTLKRTNSKAHLDGSDNQTPSPIKSPARPSAPTPNAASTKRAKHDPMDDISTRRPVERTPKPVHSRPRPGVRSSLMTPTRASAARTTSFSVKPQRTSMLPSLARSPAAKPSTIPRTPQTEFNPRLKSNIPTLGNLKSILRRHQPLFSRDPAKIAAGTHQTAPNFSPSALLKPPREASTEAAQTPSPKKHVEFASNTDTDTQMDDAPASPSPSKIPMASRPFSDISYPALPTLTPEKSIAKPVGEAKTPSIRPVRPSEVPANNSSLPEVPGVPHGIGHKKRHREAAEGQPDTENVPPADPISEARSAKRVKLNSPAPAKMPTPSPIKARSQTPSRSGSLLNRSRTPASVRQKNRGALSASRLNMLAQPKNRP